MHNFLSCSFWPCWLCQYINFRHHHLDWLTDWLTVYRSLIKVAQTGPQLYPDCVDTEHLESDSWRQQHSTIAVQSCMCDLKCDQLLMVCGWCLGDVVWLSVVQLEDRGIMFLRSIVINKVKHCMVLIKTLNKTTTLTKAAMRTQELKGIVTVLLLCITRTETLVSYMIQC